MLLLVALLEALGLVSPAVELNVSDTGDDADAGSAVTPLRSIATALTQGTATRAAGQRLTIRCSGTLREPGLDLPENVTLVGPATILCTAPQPAVRIAAAGVELRDLTLTGGAGHTGDGGAVLVTGTSDVTLERCELLGSTAGRGGGLAVLTSRQVKVRGCRIHDNSAGTPTTLAGAAVAPKLKFPAGNGHGGGIYVRDSDGTFTDRSDSFRCHGVRARDASAAISERPEASMAVVGLHCSHEQIPPSRLLEHAKHAEAAGFGAIMSSDHFSPWSERQGESGFAWSWLGAAMGSTALPFGVVNAPGQRYHPAIVAQAAATLCEMFPGRLWVALGTGEASNEHITGDPWPDKATRNARLRECVDVMRALFAGETVSHDGLVRVDRAKLHTLPRRSPPLLGPAISVDTAKWVGEWADGLVTVNQPRARLEEMIAAFRSNGGEGKRLVLQVHLSWAPSEAEALRVAHEQWRTNVFPPPTCWDLEMVEDFDGRARAVTAGQVRDVVLVSSDLARHTTWLQELASLGFDEIHLHHVGQDLTAFIDVFGEHVLPGIAA